MREWVGMENLCMLMIDDADFVQEMAETWTDLSRRRSSRYDRVELDNVHLSEDMAYKARRHTLRDGAPVFDALLSALEAARSRKAAARSMIWTRMATSRC